MSAQRAATLTGTTAGQGGQGRAPSSAGPHLSSCLPSKPSNSGSDRHSQRQAGAGSQTRERPANASTTQDSEATRDGIHWNGPNRSPSTVTPTTLQGLPHQGQNRGRSTVWKTCLHSLQPYVSLSSLSTLVELCRS
jgi:hypothetical protein